MSADRSGGEHPVDADQPVGERLVGAPDAALAVPPVPGSTRAEKIRRRVRTIPILVLAFLAITLLFPLLFVAAVIVDLTRWVTKRAPWMAVRLLTFAWVFTGASLRGLVSLGFSWVRRGAWMGRGHQRLLDDAVGVQSAWAGTLLRAVRGLMGVRFEVSGDEAIEPGPIIVMIRHASIVDNLLPSQFVTAPHGIRLRYVLKRELLNDPALDVGGNRLQNYFAARASDNPEREIAGVRALSHDLGPGDGVLVYPEGTRFTEERRRRAIEKVKGSDPELGERAAGLRHLLPPRLGGPLSLLDAGTDVVVCAHHGLAGFTRIGDAFGGRLVGRTVYVQFWRAHAADIPADRDARVDWLYGWWERIDAWIEQRAADEVAGGDQA